MTAPPLLRYSALLLVISGLSFVAEASYSDQASTESSMTVDQSHEVDEAAQSALLEDAYTLLSQKQPNLALRGPIEEVIKAYERAYHAPGVTYYSSRSPVEALFYLLQTAVKHDQAEAVADEEGEVGDVHADSQNQKAVVLFWHWSEAWYLKGYAFIELGRLDDARKALQTAIDMAPVNSLYKAEMAHIYQLEKDFSKSLELYEEAEQNAVEFSPEHARSREQGRALRGQGYALVELDQLDEAEKKYRESMRVDSSDAMSADELRYIERVRSEREPVNSESP